MIGDILTYGQFAALAKAKGWTAQYLAEQFRGKIESPSEYFHRLMDPKNADCAIAYRPVLEFYHRTVAPPARDPERKPCACGCGRPLSGRKKLATGYCRVKMSRRRSATLKSGSKKAKGTKDFSVINPASPG